MPLVTLSGWWWRALPLAPKKRTPSTSSATGVIVIVLNGRNDSEKLDELLGAGEGTHLDYKETLDLATSADKLSIVKDLVSVSNRPGGGYLVIGVGDQMLTSRAVTGSIDRKLLQCGCGAGSADGDRGHSESGQIARRARARAAGSAYAALVRSAPIALGANRSQ